MEPLSGELIWVCEVCPLVVSHLTTDELGVLFVYLLFVLLWGLFVCFHFKKELGLLEVYSGKGEGR